jgi:uncharacterized membrane protein
MGVRGAKYRLAKWKVKKYEAKGKKLSPETEAKMSKAFAQQENLEIAVKQILDTIGVPTWSYAAYINFGREIFGIKRRYAGDELDKRIETVMTKWLERKLDKTILEKIKNRVLEMNF